MENALQNTVLTKGVVSLGAFMSSVYNRTNSYLKFDSVASYGKMPMITMSGDFEVEFYILGNNTTKDQAIFDSQEFALDGNDGYVLMYLDNPDGLQLLVGDAGTGFVRYVFGGFTQILNNQFNKINFKRVGSTYSAYINDVQIGSNVTGVTKDVIIEGYFFGGKGRYLDGIGSDLKIWTGGDSSTGTLERNYFIDEKGNDIQVDLASGQNMTLFNVDHSNDWYSVVDGKFLGVELITEPYFDNAGDWVVENGASITTGELVFADGSVSGVSQKNFSFGSEEYRVQFNVTDFKGSIIGISSNTIAGGLYASGLGLVEYFGPCDGTATDRFRLVSTIGGAIGYASLRKYAGDLS